MCLSLYMVFLFICEKCDGILWVFWALGHQHFYQGKMNRLREVCCSSSRTNCIYRKQNKKKKPK